MVHLEYRNNMWKNRNFNLYLDFVPSKLLFCFQEWLNLKEVNSSSQFNELHNNHFFYFTHPVRMKAKGRLGFSCWAFLASSTAPKRGEKCINKQ